MRPARKTQQRLRTWSGLLLAALLLSSSRLYAQTPPAQESAIELYGKGRDALSLGKPQEALPLLERSYALLNSPNTELLMAHANRDLGRNVEALELYTRAESNARGEVARGQARYVETAEEARRAADGVARLVGTLAVKAPPGARVEIFRRPGDVVVVTGSGRVAVEPGEVRVVVITASGKQDRIALATAGNVTEVALVASALVAAPFEPPPRFGALAIAGGVASGVGLVGLGLFAGFGTSAQATYTRLEECGAACDEIDVDQAAELRVDGTRAQTSANASLGVGATLVAGGVVLIIIDAVSDPTDPGLQKSGASPLLSLSEDGVFAGISLRL